MRSLRRNSRFLRNSDRLMALGCVLVDNFRPSGKDISSMVREPMAQYKGTVKWFNNAKGYGFLGREDGPDVFVHYSSIKLEGYKTLKEGDEVEFDVIQGTKGPQADQVVRTKAG